MQQAKMTMPKVLFKNEAAQEPEWGTMALLSSFHYMDPLLCQCHGYDTQVTAQLDGLTN